jgi:uncharacterized membrane protein
MDDNYFSFSEKAQKIKSKSLSLSAVSLFIGLTQSLPTQVSVIGLDLKDKEVVLAWFIFGITFVFFIHFLLLAVVEITNYYSSSLLTKKLENASGNTYGRTSKEFEAMIAEDNYLEHVEKEATLDVEFKEMQEKQSQIKRAFKGKNVNIYNCISLLMELVLPIALAALGMFYLLRYMASLT